MNSIKQSSSIMLSFPQCFQIILKYIVKFQGIIWSLCKFYFEKYQNLEYMKDLYY